MVVFDEIAYTRYFKEIANSLCCKELAIKITVAVSR